MASCSLTGWSRLEEGKEPETVKPRTGLSDFLCKHVIEPIDL